MTSALLTNFHSLSSLACGCSAVDRPAGGEWEQLRGHCEHGEHRHRQHASQGDQPGTPEVSIATKVIQDDVG